MTTDLLKGVQKAWIQSTRHGHAILFRASDMLTRRGIDAFIQRERTSFSRGLVLNLGSGGRSVYDVTPDGISEVGIDIVAGPHAAIIGDSHTLPIKSGCITGVVARETLEHFHTPEQVVREIDRVLIPGGKIIVTTRFLFPIHSEPYDYFRYTEYGLRHVFRYFADVHIVPQDQTLLTIAALLARLSVDGRKPKMITRAVMMGLSYIIFVAHMLGGSWFWSTERYATGYFLVATKATLHQTVIHHAL